MRLCFGKTFLTNRFHLVNNSVNPHKVSVNELSETSELMTLIRISERVLGYCMWTPPWKPVNSAFLINRIHIRFNPQKGSVNEYFECPNLKDSRHLIKIPTNTACGPNNAFYCRWTFPDTIPETNTKRVLCERSTLRTEWQNASCSAAMWSD